LHLTQEHHPSFQQQIHGLDHMEVTDWAPSQDFFFIIVLFLFLYILILFCPHSFHSQIFTTCFINYSIYLFFVIYLISFVFYTLLLYLEFTFTSSLQVQLFLGQQVPIQFIPFPVARSSIVSASASLFMGVESYWFYTAPIGLPLACLSLFYWCFFPVGTYPSVLKMKVSVGISLPNYTESYPRRQ
jgi:hypothetical protein